MIHIPFMSVLSEGKGNAQLVGLCILFQILVLENHLLMYSICCYIFMYYLSAPFVYVQSSQARVE